MRACAIIPVRRGSKRILRKNLKLLCGKPLLAHILDAALASECFVSGDVRVVSDDDDALELAERMGATPVIVPASMANDDSPVIPVLQTALKMMPATATHATSRPDLVCYLRATSPFVRPDTIQRAVASLYAGGTKGERVDSVVSVQQVTGAHPSRFKMCDPTTGLLIDAFHDFPEGLQPVSSATLTALQRNSAITVMWSETLLEKESLWGTRIKPMVMHSDREGLDINTLLEFDFAEFLAQQR